MSARRKSRAVAHEDLIVWEMPIRDLRYVRETQVHTRTRRRAPKECPGLRVGYAVLRGDAPNCGSPGLFVRRVFWLAEHDYDREGGCYDSGSGPCEAVNPRRVRAGVGSRRGDLSEPSPPSGVTRALYLELAAKGFDLRTGEVGEPVIRAAADVGRAKRLLESVRANRDGLWELLTDEDEPDLEAIREEGSA